MKKKKKERKIYKNIFSSLSYHMGFFHISYAHDFYKGVSNSIFFGLFLLK